MNSGEHQVGRVALDCKVFAADDPSGAKVAELQETASNFCQQELPAILDRIFDRLDDRPGGHLVFDRLELDLGLIGRDDWAGECRRRLAETSALAAGGQWLSEDAWFRRVLGDYLRTGFTPWNAVSLSPADWLGRLTALSAGADREEMEDLMNVSPQARNRFKSLASGLGLGPGGLEKKLTAASVGRTTPSSASADQSGPPAGAGPGENTDDRNTSSGWPERGVPVNNAGLVLLSPFLPHFFRYLHLTNDQKRFPTVHDHSRAVWASQMIVDFPDAEGNLTFNKILCGWPPDRPLEAAPDKSEREVNEIDRLLRSVIMHWSALDRTSPSFLVYNFIRRGGLIQRPNAYYQLTVERRPHDVLLQALPWVLSLIQTPWMKEPMQVIWDA